MNASKIPDDWFPRALPSAVRMGENSWLYSSFAFLHFNGGASESVRIGSNSGLYHGTFFDLSGAAEISVGDYCSIVGAIFCTEGRITIGDYVFISHEVVISDSPFAAPRRLAEAKLAPRASSHIIIEDDVWIGAQALICGSVKIGRGSIIGAAALVDRDVPPFSIFAGNPGRIVGNTQSPMP